MPVNNESTREAAHDLFSRLVGEWAGTTKLWIEPGKLAGDFQTRGKIRKMDEGEFYVHEYTETIQDKPHRGRAIYAFNDEAKAFECVWIHSWHMNQALLISTGSQRSNSFSVHGTYGDGQNGPRWGWRTEHAIESPNQLVITAYNITPSGEEAKAVETIYTRKK